MGSRWLQMPRWVFLKAASGWLFTVIEREKAQLPLWAPIFLGFGIIAWFVLPTQESWIAVMCFGGALSILGLCIGRRHALGFALSIAGLLLATGCGLIWVRATYNASKVLTAPKMVRFEAIVLAVEPQIAREQVRLTLATHGNDTLPKRVRVNVGIEDWPQPDQSQAQTITQMITSGARISIRARLMPPPGPALPGSYDFARIAWFQGIGAVGRSVGTPVVLNSAMTSAPIRTYLSQHIASRVDAGQSGIAIALVTGDQAQIADADQEAMRASGLAHLLSISGLHITAVVAAAMFLSLRLLALSEYLALRFRLPIISAGFGAAAGLGYTLLTGAQVPTVRSFLASLLILLGLVLGREALTLRLVATGALIILFLWPESIIGPSFQLSFAAITALVALHEWPWVQRMTRRDEDRLPKRMAKAVLSLALTGIAVELALMPIALYHFHESGVYGAIANMIAIPLTTFVIMPAEALALLADSVGMGGIFWWVVEQGLAALLYLAHGVAAQPNSVVRLPEVPVWALALIVGGGLWILLWKTRMRLMGFPVFFMGILASIMTPQPDLLITGDGQHLAFRTDEGELAILRGRAGDYVRDTLAERAGVEPELPDADWFNEAKCSPDVCLLTLNRGGRVWKIAATRSRHYLEWSVMTSICATHDIVISDRMLPKKCQPRWFKADRQSLKKTGGMAIALEAQKVTTMFNEGDDHPWVVKTAR
jgi:competence protein ComEC